MIWTSGYPHTSDFGKAYHEAMGAPWIPPRHPVAIVDLTMGPEGWRNYLRPSYKSLINWGRNNMDWSVEPDLSVMQSFHAKVAGRVTRSQETWDLLQGEIDKGHGELLTGRIENELVSAGLFIDGGGVTIYWSGVYERSLFPKPLAHYGIWLEMERARDRGMKVLELGEVPEQGAVSEKEYNIGRFKRGFATGYVMNTDVHEMNAA
jgi:hypothetical protein